MKIDIVTPTWPPFVCGIGDYTATLAGHLAKTATVVVLTTVGQEHTPVPGVTLKSVFRLSTLSDIRKIRAHVEQDKPDWLLLQYDPFSFEARGLNLHVPLVMHRLRRENPRLRLAVMVHEACKAIKKPSHLVSTLWVHWSLWTLGRAADLLLFSIDPWVERYARWFPRTEVRHLPVGSNIPEIALSRHEARERLNIGPDSVVLGLFGRLNPSLSVVLVQAAVQAVRDAGRQPLVLYIGTQGAQVVGALPGVPLIADGPLAADEVSRRFRAMDVFLTPFADGVSTRRTSLLTGLQHGIPTVGTWGPATDKLLRNLDNKALLLTEVDKPEEYGDAIRRLVEDDAFREHLGRQARAAFQANFSWGSIIGRLTSSMEAHTAPA